MKSNKLRPKQRLDVVVRQILENQIRQNTSSIVLGGLLAVGLLAGTSAAHAQNTGSVFGTVQDKTGAVVPKATVVIADTEHGVTRTVTSNGSGQFQLDQLPVGDYILTVTAPTFQTAVVTDLHVDANANVKEPISLLSGATSDTISVEDTSGSVDTRSAQLQTLIDQKLIEDLPIDGHNVVALSALLPGVVDVNAPATFTGDTAGPTFSASGSRNTQNLFLFDGLIFNNLYYNTGVNYPTPNALQEVSVILNNYKAQYGRNAGSVFNVITKKGGNVIHGAVWDYLQNQIFDASDYISHVNPKNNINQFGFTVGGPILKDKLFYFGAYQQFIGRLQTTASAPTPGLAERGLLADGVTPRPCTPGVYAGGTTCASFAGDVTANGVLGKFLNPVEIAGTSGAQATPATSMAIIQSNYQQAGGVGTSPCLGLLAQAATYANQYNYGNSGKLQQTYLPNAELPTACLDPVILNPYNKAQPGIFDTFVPLPTPGAGGYAITRSPAPTGDKNALARMDYNINGQNEIDARYNLFTSSLDAPTGVNSQSQVIATYALVNSHAKGNFVNIGYQRILTPALLNQMRVGYKRFETYQFPDDNRTLNNFGGNFVETGIPTLPSISLGSSVFNLGSASQGYQDHINENVQVSEQISWTKGNHNIVGGYDFLRLQYLTRSDYPGQLSFSTTFTGVSIADAEAGLPASVTAQNRLIQGGIQHNDFFYLQDDWRLSPRLTLNLGVRYELPFQWFEPHGQAATFIPGIQSAVFPTAPGGLAFPGDKGVLPSLVPTDFNGIAPRLGFAYDLSGKGTFLVRGGYGVFFDAVNANVIGVGQPYHFTLFETTPLGGASNPLATEDSTQSYLVGGVTVLPGAFNPKNPQFIAPYSLFFPDPHFRTPYVQAVNFGFQYHIPHGGTLDTNYVGKFARKLTVPVDLNPGIFDCTGGYYQADPGRYCDTANSTAYSQKQRLRYADFNYGGQGIVDIESVANSSYNALQAQYTQRGGRYLNILSSYTYSRSIDIQTNGQTTANSVPDVFNLKSDRGPSDNNATHIFSLGWVTRYPKVTSFVAPVNEFLNNWVFGGTYQAHTGRPYSVTINNDTALDDEPNQRAAIVPGMNPRLPSNRHRSAKVAEYFNPFAFTYPNIGTFSNVGRNAFVGPGYIMTNMNLGRDFPLSNVREGMRINIRAEAFNIFNTPNLSNPQSSFSCSSTAISTEVTSKNPNPPNPVACNSSVSPTGAAVSSPGTLGGLIPGTNTSQFGQIRSTFGNNSNTSTNGRKMQFELTLFY
jgi:hypothetical protein